VSFIPFFGSALQVTPHFHSLVPDGVFVPREGGVRFEPLPPPTQAEVERLLRVVRQFLLPQVGAEPGLEEESPAFAATVEEPSKERTPGLDLAGLLQ
jgi:hypothetical protein